MIVAFYSFKGGVGRTMALAHTARFLAKRSSEQSILAVDLDLEAPGLDCYFRFPGAESCRGIAGLIFDYNEQPEAERQEWLRRVLTDESYGYVMRSPGKLENLWYMPSGLSRDSNKDVTYGDVTKWLRREIASQDRSRGWPVLANQGFLSDLREALEECFAYTLIDSRTGLADESFASTVLLARALVVCVRLNRTHLDGVRTLLASFVKREGLTIDDPRLPLIPVVTPLPTRGGKDIQYLLDEGVLRLFARARPLEEDLETWEHSPLLAVDTAFVRLYEEPYLEIDELMLVNEAGELVAGFDERVPLVQGYRDLVQRITLINYCEDPGAAAFLEDHYLGGRGRTGQANKYLALRYWCARARQRLGAFSNLPVRYNDKRVGPEAVSKAREILEQWEMRIPEDDAETHDHCAWAWSDVAELAIEHAQDMFEQLDERAIRAARSSAVKGLVLLAHATRLQSHLIRNRPEIAQSTAIVTSTDEPWKPIIKLLVEAEKALSEAVDQDTALFFCFQQQLKVYQSSQRYEDAVAALEKAFVLSRSGSLPIGIEFQSSDIITLCGVLGQLVIEARTVLKDTARNPGLSLLQLTTFGWHNRVRELAAKAEGLTSDIRLFLELHFTTDRAEQIRIIAQLPPRLGYYAEICVQIFNLAPSFELLKDIEKYFDQHPELVAYFGLWARLFDHPTDLSDPEIYASIRRDSFVPNLGYIFDWIVGKRQSSAQALKRRPAQTTWIGQRVHDILFFGLNAAFRGNYEDARRCAQMLNAIGEVAPDAIVNARKSVGEGIARAVLRQLAERGRVSPEAQASLDELWRVMDAPPAPPEPDNLDQPWHELLTPDVLDRMRKAAALLERLPQELDDLLAASEASNGILN